MERRIMISHAPNGFVVTEALGREFVSKTLAVFNRMEDLTAWLATNFQLPDSVDAGQGDKGGAA